MPRLADMDEQKVCDEYYNGAVDDVVWDEDRPLEDYRIYECKWELEWVISEPSTWWDPPLMYLDRAIRRGQRKNIKP